MKTITDQTFAPIFCAWMMKELDMAHPFGPETRYIAFCDVNEKGELEIGTCTALNTWSQGACEAHIASTRSTKKADAEYIYTVFDYAFRHADVNCMTTNVATTNTKSIRLQERLGFKRVGLVEGFYGPDEDAYFFSITKQQWLDGKWGSSDPEGVI